MDNLEEKIQETIKKYNLIQAGDKLVLAVSGGPDSICMLNAFVNLTKNCHQAPSPATINCRQAPSPTTIIVAHVNHMLRKEAYEDECFVRDYCEKNQIDFYSKSIDVKKIANTKKIGLEEAGRFARYEFFDEVLKMTNANKIAVAHNKNDKVETVFMHLLRGCGIEGLRGIEPKRGNIIRPLIDCERYEIEAYCERMNLNPRIDKTNADNSYTRNKIRNVVIPYIQKEFNPNIINTMDKLSKIVSMEDDFLEMHTAMIYNNLLIEENPKQQIIIDLKNFNSQEMVIKSRIIRYIIKRLFNSSNSIEKIHIDDIIQLCQNNIGNKYLTPNKNVKVLLKNHKIYFINQN